MSGEIDYRKRTIKYIKDNGITSVSQIEESTKYKGNTWENFSCFHMSKNLGTNFQNIQEIGGVLKYKITDKDGNDIGIDLFDENTTIVQCKNYKANHKFQIQDLTNSISLRMSDEKIKYQLYFARPDDTKIGTKLKTHLDAKRFIDYPIPRKEYIEFLNSCIEEIGNWEEDKNNYQVESKVDNKDNEIKIQPDIRQKRQDELLEKITSFLHSEKKIFSLCAATGFGKTVIATRTIQHLINNTTNNNFKILILVHRVVMVEQWYEHLSDKSNEQIYLSSHKHIQPYNNQNIIICLFNSIDRILSLKLSFNLIIVDEAHNIRNPRTYKEAYEDFSDNDSQTNSGYNSDDDEEMKKDSEMKIVSNLTVKKIKELLDKRKIAYKSKQKRCELLALLNIQKDDEKEKKEENKEEYCNEDEDKDEPTLVKTNYTKKILQLYSYNKILELSATIDPYHDEKISQFEKISLRDSIDKHYLCDYNILFPIFSSKNYLQSLGNYISEKAYFNTIIYCKNEQESCEFRDILNTIFGREVCQSITCNTPTKERKKYIEQFRKGDLLFLTNIRILTEGFDAPIATNAIILSDSKEKVALIQILGRILRLYPNKRMGNLIIPVSKSDDTKKVNNFIKILKDNDELIETFHKQNNLRRYISFPEAFRKDKSLTEEEIEIAEFLYEETYDSAFKIMIADSVKNASSFVIKENRIPKQYDKMIPKVKTEIEKEKDPEKKKQLEMKLENMVLETKYYTALNNLRKPNSSIVSRSYAMKQHPLIKEFLEKPNQNQRDNEGVGIIVKEACSFVIKENRIPKQYETIILKVKKEIEKEKDPEKKKQLEMKLENMVLETKYYTALNNLRKQDASIVSRSYAMKQHPLIKEFLERPNQRDNEGVGIIVKEACSFVIKENRIPKEYVTIILKVKTEIEKEKDPEKKKQLEMKLENMVMETKYYKALSNLRRQDASSVSRSYAMKQHPLIKEFLEKPNQRDNEGVGIIVKEACSFVIKENRIPKQYDKMIPKVKTEIEKEKDPEKKKQLEMKVENMVMETKYYYALNSLRKPFASIVSRSYAMKQHPLIKEFLERPKKQNKN